jgi:hypothetical protein
LRFIEIPWGFGKDDAGKDAFCSFKELLVKIHLSKIAT